jgi:hypothetical protein
VLLLCRIETGVAVAHPCRFAVVQSIAASMVAARPSCKSGVRARNPHSGAVLIAAGATVPSAMPSPSEPMSCKSKSENGGTSFRSSAPMLKRGSYAD